MNDPLKRGLKRGLMLSLGLAALLGLGWALTRAGPQPDDPAAAYASAVGGPFTLVDTNGRAFASTRLDGKPFAIFFGFTRCPDVCPTTLARMTRLRQRLGADGDRFDIVFVSVDPEQDTPEAMGRYLTLFDTPIIGLTGTRAQVEAAERAYRVYARRVPLEGGGYTMDHTATVYLMGSRGQFVTTLDAHEGDGPALDKLRRLIAAQGGRT